MNQIPNDDTDAPRGRGPLLVGAVFVLMIGIFIGALSATVLLRMSIGSAGDLKAREATALHALIEAPDGIVAPDISSERTTAAFAHSFIVSTAAIDAVSSLDERAKLVDIARWMVATDALSAREDAVSRWAMIAARCVDTNAEAPKDAANCVRDEMPHDVPIPDHARD
ncbi:hypothetical protein LU699_10450 [Luteimonas fraxinea]|uniref:Uncharacterized protein n=1 Tax=Luteimonas fraxinea TaxID=2901869 RepID=A0ABS8UHY9_9GAMM|nr:hypothetical protein [Luteimonas fraxinea]MCD9098329.1 hypothetical protein [Luteimonas fraxinea]MCD9127061.1 hypothetical protein [Luteimonas fraxinea]UHH08737.1 hypothetical protein LU699_10450 [Luteimonas fraxinea]